MKRYIIILLALMLGLVLQAEVHSNAGKYGYKFLDIPVSPVSMALAGRGIHSPANSSAWLTQPAATCMQNAKSAAVSHSAWIAETAYTTAWYSNARRSSHLGLAWRNLNYGDIEKRDETGFLIGHYQPVDIAVNGNYAHRLNPYLYAGVNLGVIYQKLDTASSLAMATDLGFTALPPLKDSAVSLAARNLGVANKTDLEAAKLPFSFDVDMYKGFELGQQHLGLEAGVTSAVDSDLRYTLSAELKLVERLYLRGGYKLNYDAESFTAGMGIELSRFVIDYGFAAMDKGLGDVHSFGLRYNF